MKSCRSSAFFSKSRLDAPDVSEHAGFEGLVHGRAELLNAAQIHFQADRRESDQIGQRVLVLTYGISLLITPMIVTESIAHKLSARTIRSIIGVINKLTISRPTLFLPDLVARSSRPENGLAAFGNSPARRPTFRPACSETSGASKPIAKTLHDSSTTTIPWQRPRKIEYQQSSCLSISAQEAKRNREWRSAHSCR